MKSLGLAVLLSLFLGHDVPIATFRIYNEQGHPQLGINLDTKDLCKTLGVATAAINLELLQTYLETHVDMVFDDTSHKIRVQDIMGQSGHLQIRCIFEPAVPKDFGCLRIENTCLLDLPNQSNIIQLETTLPIRDFRMHRGRTLIEIEH